MKDGEDFNRQITRAAKPTTGTRGTGQVLEVETAAWVDVEVGMRRLVRRWLEVGGKLQRFDLSRWCLRDTEGS